ncbi:histone-like nucleoid-structuring protein Lsr2 [Paenarthrobacter sp. RAF54_2]|uniref:Lsr2 dimerization domain-containing protein n=1 Tax=Paenarthrobacter sp. RAF54_2 TaxID=3233061 RepID=UPI003F97FC56
MGSLRSMSGKGGSGHLERVSFSLDGTLYEVDLRPAEAEKLRSDLRPYIDAARPVDQAREPDRAVDIDAPTAADIRLWAKEHGLPVAEIGSLSATIIKYYNAVYSGEGRLPS